MKKYNILNNAVLLFTVIISFVSCNKDEAINTKYLQAYLSPVQFQNDASLPLLSFEVYADGTVNQGKSDASIAIENPVKLSKASTADLTVNLALGDTSLVSTYNNTNNTTYRKIPSGALKLSQTSFVIKAGKTMPEEKTINIGVANGKLLEMGAKEYLVPITISGVESKDEGAKFGKSVVYVKVKATGTSAAITTTTGANFMEIVYVNNGSGIYVAPADGSFQVKLNPAATVASTVETAIGNEDMVAEYNKTNKTNYTLLPAANCTISNSGNAVFAIGQSVANLTFKLVDGQQLDYKKKYLLPIYLKQGNVVFTDQQAKMIMVSFVANVTNIDLSKTTATGTAIARTGWSIAGFSTQEMKGEVAPATNLIDASTSTIWHSIWYTPQPDGATPAMPQWFSVNMGKQNTIKCFTYLNRANSLTGQPANIEILTSNDGTTWLSQGVYKATQQTSGYATPRVINLYAPVTAQYFKFNITSTFSNLAYTFLADVGANQ